VQHLVRQQCSLHSWTVVFCRTFEYCTSGSKFFFGKDKKEKQFPGKANTLLSSKKLNTIVFYSFLESSFKMRHFWLVDITYASYSVRAEVFIQLALGYFLTLRWTLTKTILNSWLGFEVWVVSYEVSILYPCAFTRHFVQKIETFICANLYVCSSWRKWIWNSLCNVCSQCIKALKALVIFTL